MDVNDFRNAVTLLSFALFAGIVGWAWSRRNQAGFAEAASLPFVAEAASLPFVAEAASLPFIDESGPAEPEPRHE